MPKAPKTPKIREKRIVSFVYSGGICVYILVSFLLFWRVGEGEKGGRERGEGTLHVFPSL
jgi:hypothetical protein